MSEQEAEAAKVFLEVIKYLPFPPGVTVNLVESAIDPIAQALTKARQEVQIENVGAIQEIASALQRDKDARVVDDYSTIYTHAWCKELAQKIRDNKDV